MRINQPIVVIILALTMYTFAGPAIAMDYYDVMSNEQLKQALAAAEKELEVCNSEIENLTNYIALAESGSVSVRIPEFNAYKAELPVLKKCVADAHKKVAAIRKEILSRISVGDLGKSKRDRLIEMKSHAQKVERAANGYNNTINKLQLRFYDLSGNLVND